MDELIDNRKDEFTPEITEIPGKTGDTKRRLAVRAVSSAVEIPVFVSSEYPQRDGASDEVRARQNNETVPLTGEFQGDPTRVPGYELNQTNDIAKAFAAQRREFFEDQD